MIDLKDKKISIIGAVRSGLGAAKLAKKIGAIPFVSDSGSEEKLKLSIEYLRNDSINFEVGKHSDKVFDCDLMVVSPGVPSNADVILQAQKRELNIISEIEFASYFNKANIIAITGTNGKTTTTTLCGYLFNHCGVKTYTAGNIGLAFSEVAPQTNEKEYISLEVSSFQLDLIDKFKPKISMILNITPDHLNRYENSLEKYAQSKLRIYKNQDASDFLIINKDSGLLYKYLTKTNSQVFFFSTDNKVSNGCYLFENDIRFVKDSKEEFTFPVSELSIKGEHNVQNAMAVIIAAKIINLNNEKIKEALRTFEGVEHRLELVREIDGIKFINDSKATNVDSVIVALKSFNDPIFLILGGRDKGNDYSQIENLVEEKVKKIYAIGESAEKVFNYFHKKVKTELKKNFQDVINTALSEARKGDIVLLSPACASFDMFDSYEHRGKVFKELVNKI